MEPIKKIIIEVIPHHQQRYDVVGDYYQVKDFRDESMKNESDDTWVIRLSDLFTNEELFALMQHELWEWFMAIRAGVTMKEIDEYEMKSHQEHPDEDPDLDPNSPVHVPARFAIAFERAATAILGVNHEQYEGKMVYASKDRRDENVS